MSDDFADGYAAAASVNGWLTGINKDDAAVMREHLALARSRLAKAKELAPANPRVLWVEGGALYFGMINPPACDLNLSLSHALPR